jgi:hypothetical protein
MHQAKKSKKILSALSMAAVAALGAKTAHGMTLQMYYGNDPTYTNSNNSVLVGTSYATSGSKDTQGEDEYLSGATPQAITGGVQTITVPIGDYLSLAIDAVLTGNVNADAGVNSGTGTKPSNHQVQPSFLGLSQLDVFVPASSTGVAANILSPITSSGSNVVGKAGAPYTGTVYSSTGNLNQSIGNNTPGQGGYNSAPTWVKVAETGGIEPNSGIPIGWNYSGGANGTTDSGSAGTASANIGINEDPSGGDDSTVLTSASAVNTPTGVKLLTQFAGSSASYGSATDFVDNLIYQGLTAGLVTLTPTVNTAATAYWTRSTAGSTSSLTTYTTDGFDTNSTPTIVNNVPMIVIDVVAASSVSSSHAIVNLAATAGANATNYPGQVGVAVTGTFSPATSPTLTVTGGNGSYTTAQVTAINSGAGVATGNVAAATWSPVTDTEIYGVDVKVGGNQATGAQLAALISAIDGDGVAPASVGVVAATTDPTHGDLSGLDGGGVYNLFLTISGAGLPDTSSDDLGLDLSQTNDSNLVGLTFTAVAVVPEPMSLGLLAVGGVGLMARRSRRNKA